MADVPPPARLSKAYILGLSNKPWKDPPKPPPMDSWKGIIGTPGAALEWVASDGRRGALTGKGKSRGPRITLGAAVAAKEQAKVDAGQGTASVNHDVPKNENKNEKGGPEASKDSGGEVNNAGDLEYKKVPSADWTDEQDNSLFHMKVEQKNWGDITGKLGKTKQECTTRWKEIMPDNFYQNENQGKGGTKGSEQDDKQGKGMNKQQDKQEQQKKEEEEGNGKKAEEPSGGDDAWGGALDMFNQEVNNKSNASKKDDKNTAPDPWNSGGWSGGDHTNAKQDDKNGAYTWGSGGDDWIITASGKNTGATPGWGNSTGDMWNADTSKDDKKSEKSDGKKVKEDKKRDKDSKKDEKSKSGKVKETKGQPNATADPWGSGGGDMFDIGEGDATTGGWGGDDNPWDAGGNKDKKSDGKSKSSSSRSFNAGSKKSCGGWSGSNAASPWGDNKNDSGAAAPAWGNDTSRGGGGNNIWGNDDGGPSWGADATEKKDSKDKSRKKEEETAAPWNADGWDGAGSPKKASSRSSSKERKKCRSDKHSSRRDSDPKEKHNSRRHHSSSYPAEYKVAPDDTFSQDELRLIARILQQDCSMV